MKLLVVSQYYAPEPFRVTDLCEALVRRGHDVTVLCGIPNYPEGRYYPGHSIWRRRKEMLNGVRVIRSWLFPRGRGGKGGLIVNYLSYLGSAWLRHFRLARQGYDAVFCYEVSPLTMALPAVSVARRAGIPLLLYLTDLWPENVEAVNGVSNRRILDAIGKMAGYIYRHCDRILIPSPRFFDPVASRGADPGRIVYWPQYAEDFADMPLQPDGSQPPEIPPDALEAVSFPVVFTGNLGFAQGLDVLVEAAALLDQETDAVFFLVGDGRARASLEEKVARAGMRDRIRFCGRVPAQDVPAYLNRAGTALLTLAPDPVFSLYLPAKLPSYLAAGIPILCAADGAPADVVDNAGAGLSVPAGDAQALADAVGRLSAMPAEERDEMGRNARACFEEQFTRDKRLDELEIWLNNPLNGTSGGQAT